MAVAYTGCECKEEEAKLSNKLARVYNSDSGDSEEDDDGEYLSFYTKTWQRRLNNNSEWYRFLIQ